MFVSHSSLWSTLDCVDAEKTRVYLERSRSSPINLRLRRGLSLASINASLQIIPQAIDQLKSLTVASKPGDLEIVIPATFSKNRTWMGAIESHRITQYSHLRSSMETSLCCANFTCRAFALDYLGETW